MLQGGQEAAEGGVHDGRDRQRIGVLRGRRVGATKHAAESSAICPASRHAYRSRGCTPCANAVSVVNVDGTLSPIAFMDKIHAHNRRLCAYFIRASCCRYHCAPGACATS